MAHGEIANNAAHARRHYRVTFALLALAGLAIPPRRPADAFAPHEAGDLAEVASRQAPRVGADAESLSAGESPDLTLRRPRSFLSSMTMLSFDTTIGTCGVRWSEAGIGEVVMPRSRGLVGERFESSSDVPEDIRDAVAGMVALLDGERRDLRWVALDERHIDAFRRRVYAATREIGRGSTASYGEVARAVGEPRAAREVGVALAQNPFPIIVPCHRVLAATGALHGFSAPGGIATKRRMLEIEGAPGFAQEALFA